MAKPALVDCGAVKFSIWKMAHRDNQKNNNSQCKEEIKLHHSLLSYFARSCDLLSATFVKPSHSALFQMKVVPENCPLVQHHIVLWCSTIMYWLQMTDTLGFESSNWPLARGLCLDPPERQRLAPFQPVSKSSGYIEDSYLVPDTPACCTSHDKPCPSSATTLTQGRANLF
jgi:hypothetical protein